MSKRRKRVAPGTRINPLTTSADELGPALSFADDFNVAMDELDKLRARCVAEGWDPYEELAHLVAHNWAAKQGTLRLKARGARTGRLNAEKRRAEIIEQLKEAKGNVKAVVIDREGSAEPASSDRTVRRAKARSTKP